MDDRLIIDTNPTIITYTDVYTLYDFLETI